MISANTGCCLCSDCEMQLMGQPVAALYNLDEDVPVSCQDFSEQVFDRLESSNPRCSQVHEAFQSVCCPKAQEMELSDTDVEAQHRQLQQQEQPQTIPFSGRELFWSSGNDNPISNFISSLNLPSSSYRPWDLFQSKPITTLFNAVATGCTPAPNAIGCLVPPNRSTRQVNMFRPNNSGLSSNAHSVRCGSASLTGVGLLPGDQLFNVMMACVRSECCGCGSDSSARVCQGNNHVPAPSGNGPGGWTWN